MVWQIFNYLAEKVVQQNKNCQKFPGFNTENGEINKSESQFQARAG